MYKILVYLFESSSCSVWHLRPPNFHDRDVVLSVAIYLIIYVVPDKSADTIVNGVDALMECRTNTAYVAYCAL